VPPRRRPPASGARRPANPSGPCGPEFTAPGNEQLKFTGHERDHSGSLVGAADGFDYMHARYCLPDFGRFMSMDPARSAEFQTPQSWNRYSYALNSPLAFVDPDGREAVAATVAVGSSSFALPPFLAGAAPAAVIVGGGYFSVKIGRSIGGFEIASGLTVDSLISEFIATEIIGALPGYRIEAGALPTTMLASKPGEFDHQIAAHSYDRGHFPRKSETAILELIENVRQNGKVFKAANGNQLTVSGGIVLIDDLLSATSAGTVFMPDKLKKFIEDWLSDNDEIRAPQGD